MFIWKKGYFMKNNKGFTLVEILAVIVILSFIMIIIYPTVSDVLFGGRTTVNKLALKNIKESAEMFAQDIYICDSTSDILNILKEDLSYTDVTNCKEAKAKLQEGITIEIDVLKRYEYISRADNCEGNINLRLNGDKMTNIIVEVDNVTCTK